jgi:hypothetical protein
MEGMDRSTNDESVPRSDPASEPGTGPEAGDDAVEAEPPELTGLDPETTFDILRNSRRRHAIEHLFDADSGTVSIGELAEHIAAIENDIPPAELSSAQRKRVYVSLYQSHLPRMDDADVVRFDSDRGDVSPGRHFRAVSEYLHSTTEPHGSSRCYVALLVVGAALLAVSTVSTMLSGHLVALLILLSVGTCTTVKYLDR